MTVGLAMVGVGAFAIIAQMALIRGLFAVFAGNELTIGAVFGVWFLLVGAGAWAGRAVSRRLSAERLRRVMAVWLGLAGLLLPLNVAAAALVRAPLGVPLSEAVSLGAMLATATVVLMGPAVTAGALFPCACRLGQESGREAVSRVYGADAMGSLAGGLVFALILAPHAGALGQALAGTAAAALGAAALAGRRGRPAALALAALALGLSPVTGPAERRLEVWRWRSYGVLRGDGGDASLAASAHSRFGDLAAIRMQDQYALYESGRVLFTFPDPVVYEHRIHAIMARRPAARRVLLLGGTSAGEVPELLKYPLERLVCVQLDPAAERLLARVNPAGTAAARDPRVCFEFRDGPLFVKSCREQFDVIIVQAPEPATALVNRSYTLEFYRAARRILAPGGFLWTSVPAAEQLELDSGLLAASVWRTLRAVFPAVRVAGGTDLAFFAAGAAADAPMDREELAALARGAGVPTAYFRPEYFLATDELDPARIAFVERRLAELDAPLNTDLRPICYSLSLGVWSRLSGSGLGRLLARVRRTPLQGWLLLAGLVALGGATAGLASAARCGRAAGARVLLAFAMAGAGFMAMAFEMLMVFLFQAFFGYVYVSLALIASLFMLGLMIGAAAAHRGETGPVGRAWRLAAGAAGGLALLGAIVPGLVVWGASAGGVGDPALKAAFYALVGGVGAAVGAIFPAVTRLLRERGARTDAAAGETVLADNLGVVAGSWLTALALVPSIGIRAAGFVVSAVGVAVALWLGCARLMGTTSSARE